LDGTVSLRSPKGFGRAVTLGCGPCGFFASSLAVLLLGRAARRDPAHRDVSSSKALQVRLRSHHSSINFHILQGSRLFVLHLPGTALQFRTTKYSVLSFDVWIHDAVGVVLRGAGGLVTDTALTFAGLKNHLSVSSVVGLFDVIDIPTETCQDVGRRSQVIAR
jgi:hypothetical protein